MPDETPTNILVVDDLPEKLLTYRAILEELGQNVVTVGSGHDALRAVLSTDFAVILLDVNMPQMNGLETAALIRQRKRSAHTPIIFVTAFADEVGAAEGYAQGAVDYITTPVVPAILRAKVRVFADLYRMTQQIKSQAEERIALAEERTKREAAEESNRRLAFLTRAGAVLGQSLDRAVTARDVVRLPLTLLADEATLLTLTAQGDVEGYLHARPGPGGPVVEEGPGRGPAGPELAALLDQALAAGVAPPPGGTALVLPLRARGRVIGFLGLGRTGAGRSFPPADVSVAETLVSRAAMALENARLYHELQQADRQKNEFLSMLAHELRNPLAPIRNASEVLRHQASDPGRVRWAQGVIERQLGHMVRLVDDLLDVSRLTLGKIRLAVEPVALDAVVAQAVEATRPLLDQFGHALEVNLPAEPIRILGDKARLIQVLTNLLNNAGKYTDPGGRIVVSAERGARNPESQAERPDTPGGEPARPSELRDPRSEFVTIRVRDNGVGISAELLPAVFELFTQANRSLDRSQGGLGVGLTLVARLVEMHGGWAEAHSEGPGRGSEFVVRLPVTADEPRPAGAMTGGPSDGPTEALRVVVVDDNVDGAESLADLLAILGHEVRVAHDGQAGIAAVQEFDPDLVLLDIGLPGLDGYEVARRLRRDPACHAVLVAVSGYGRDEDRRRSREAGIEHHFVKPVDLEVIRSLLDSLRAAQRV